MMRELLRPIRKLFGKEGNFGNLSIKDQVDIMLDFFEEGKVLQEEFIETYFRLLQIGPSPNKACCKRLILLDNHPGITRDDQIGLAYDLNDDMSFTPERGSVLYRENWYERAQSKINNYEGRVSLSGLGLRFYQDKWFNVTFSDCHREALDLWTELKGESLNMRLDLLKVSPKDGRLLVARTARFKDAEDLRQQIAGAQDDFPSTVKHLSLMKGNR